MDRPIVTLAEAREQGLKRYFTGGSCKHGHVAERYTAGRGCCECARLKALTPEAKEYHAAYAAEHAEERKVRMAAYCQSDKYKAYQRSEGRRESNRLYAQAKRITHPHKDVTCQIKSKYPAAIVPLTEAEQNALRWFYVTAQELTKRTGRKYEVDHCYPLARGGLHHPLNLMILPTWANRRKHTKYQPDNPLAVRGLQLKDRLSLRIHQP